MGQGRSHAPGDAQPYSAVGLKLGYAKIAFTCRQAQRDGWSYAWVDTCCIDKTSSAELSEAINSMYRWYQKAQICYVYLSDVPPGGRVTDEFAGSDTGTDADAQALEAFRSSRWFTRGWTLQELIAPSTVHFFSADFQPMGFLADMLRVVSDVTGIDRSLLAHQAKLSDLTIAKRTSL